MGHQVEEYTYPSDLGLGSWMEDLWMVDVVYEIENRIKEVGREPLHEELEALTHYVQERVASLSAMDLYRARRGL